jgi:hypothetical protein
MLCWCSLCPANLSTQALDGAEWLATKFSGTFVTANFHITDDGGGGTLLTDPPIDRSAHTIADGGTLEIAAGATGKETFAGPTGTLQLDSSQVFTGKVAGFGGLDVIDLADIGFGASTTLGYRENASAIGGTLNASDGIHSAHIALLGNYMASSFATASDGHGGTLLTDTSAASQQPLTLPHT